MRFLYALLAAGLGAGGVYMFTDIGENWFTPAYLTRMDSGAHGYIFDVEGQEVALDNAEIIELQAELYEDALNAAIEPDDALMELAAQVQAELAIDGLNEDHIVFLRAMHMRLLVLMMGNEQRQIYDWRNSSLQRSYQFAEPVEVASQYVSLSEGLNEWLKQFHAVPYSRACQIEDVPVPPKFGKRSGIWHYQGAPAHNILLKGKQLEVWTWADPNLRGGCVALPREPTTLGGIGATGVICQSASTGHACFWDSREPASGMAIDWDTDRAIDTILDARSMPDCIACHMGNNAFLVAPDDPAWCRVMRGGQIGVPGSTCATMSGNASGTFTLEVEGMVNQIAEPNAQPPHTHSRFIPIGGLLTSQWVNDAQPDCAGTCHLRVGPTMFDPKRPLNLPKMPPKCMNNCTLP